MIRFHSIISPTYADGPGSRAALFMQGCALQCPGCENSHLWPTDGVGYLATAQGLARLLVDTDLPITITGGEPFDQANLYDLLYAIRSLDLHRHIIVYTGHVFEDLVKTGRHEILAALAITDVLVDGPYIQALSSPDMKYRGSSNKRIIDLQATLRRPAREILGRGPVLLDWSAPEPVRAEKGDLRTASPFAARLAGAGDRKPADI